MKEGCTFPIKIFMIKIAGYGISVQTQIIPDVDRVLEQMEGVISGDAIILNRCKSWLNVMPLIIGRMDHVWKIRL